MQSLIFKCGEIVSIYHSALGIDIQNHGVIFSLESGQTLGY